MKIAIAADHAGFEFKEKIKQILIKLGHEYIDLGTDSKESVDYPDFGLAAARKVAGGEADYGITVCWTGNGMNMVANKVNGIRAGTAINVEMAKLTRQHNDANMLTLSQKFTPEDDLKKIVKAFLETDFEGGRHVKRIKKIHAAEKA
ncbi:MAG: ribose 5-phosphate isomerase B [candidate division Zixibacteria bacterium]|nr:ribose 5-phosphate isomerase B [candidate division Zixibacteria bacterium]